MAKKATTTTKKKPAAKKTSSKTSKAVSSKSRKSATVTSMSRGAKPIVLHHRQMTKAELKTAREKLAERRSQIRGDVDQLEEEALAGESRDISSNHMADSSSDVYEQDFTLHMIENETTELQEIQRAIDKIDGKIANWPYGKCESCGIWISVERLDAQPHARICIKCVEKFEAEGGGEQFGVVPHSQRTRY